MYSFVYHDSNVLMCRETLATAVSFNTDIEHCFEIPVLCIFTDANVIPNFKHG